MAFILAVVVSNQASPEGGDRADAVFGVELQGENWLANLRSGVVRCNVLGILKGVIVAGVVVVLDHACRVGLF